MTEPRRDLFLRPLFDWRSAVASPFGPPNPTTRHVLLTLSLHMSPRGDSCFPSIDLLVEESGLSRRSVVEHLGVAGEQGWLAKQDRPEKSGQGWRRIEYFPMIPTGVEERVKGWAEERGARRAPRQGGARGSEGGAPGAQKVVHLVHLSTSGSSSIKGGVEAKASPVPALFEAYRHGIQTTYGAEYPPSAAANGILAKMAKRLGAGPALQVLQAYLASTKPFYVARKHALEILAKDATEIWIELQQRQAGGAPRARPVTAARVQIINADDSEGRRLQDYPPGDPQQIAKKAFTDYRNMIAKLPSARYIAVRQGAQAARFSLEELRS